MFRQYTQVIRTHHDKPSGTAFYLIKVYAANIYYQVEIKFERTEQVAIFHNLPDATAYFNKNVSEVSI